MTHAEIPSSILIVGSGVFGLTTALSLARSPYYAKSSITVVDRSEFPAEDGSSIDTSRSKYLCHLHGKYCSASSNEGLFKIIRAEWSGSLEA